VTRLRVARTEASSVHEYKPAQQTEHAEYCTHAAWMRRARYAAMATAPDAATLEPAIDTCIDGLRRLAREPEFGQRCAYNVSWLDLGSTLTS